MNLELRIWGQAFNLLVKMPVKIPSSYIRVSGPNIWLWLLVVVSLLMWTLRGSSDGSSNWVGSCGTHVGDLDLVPAFWAFGE